MTDELELAKEVVISVVPELYRDGVSPAVKELGKGLETLAKTINLALDPLRGLIWGYEQVREYLVASVTDRLKLIPKERIVPPKTSIAGPLLQSIRFSADEEAIREIFANLLARAMDANTKDIVHPAYVHIINQLTPDEAKIIEYFGPNNFCYVGGLFGEDQRNNFMSVLAEDTKIAHPAMLPSYLDNLQRLRIINNNSSEFGGLVNSSNTIRIGSLFAITDFGEQFYRMCVKRSFEDVENDRP